MVPNLKAPKRVLREQLPLLFPPPKLVMPEVSSGLSEVVYVHTNKYVYIFLNMHNV